MGEARVSGNFEAGTAPGVNGDENCLNAVSPGKSPNWKIMKGKNGREA